MAFDKKGLDDYQEVPDRIREFITKHPEGSLQCQRVEYRELPAAHKNGELCMHVIYHAAAYRSPEDPKPGHGMASEPIPGLTPYTKGSELMNAETSAWGRALVALGFVAKKVASAEEVRNRSGEDKPAKGKPKPKMSPIDYLQVLVKRNIKDTRQLEAMVAPNVKIEEGWAATLSPQEVSDLIDRLKNGEIPPVPEPTPVAASDVPEAPSGEFQHEPQGETLESLAIREGENPDAPGGQFDMDEARAEA